MENILIISTSPRKGGNSEILADEFKRGALESGHSVEKICLYDKNIGFCKGCLDCQTTKNCVI
jgi:multimeric flavodoxin WrbA